MQLLEGNNVNQNHGILERKRIELSSCSTFKMSLPFSGAHTRSKGVISAIAKQLRTLSLKPVKSIQIKFDPFHENALQTRNFFFQITTPKIIATNAHCIVKPQIVSDQSEPTVTMKLISGDNVIFKGAHLSCLNMLELYNKHITPLVDTKSTNESDEAVIEKKKKRGRVKIKQYSKHRGVFL
ncbi:39S ribosomal protein L53, mitochondrial [Colletes gigas]|uniref:39S ribosomal protein L53, mitochondrial n=1 Tax=Colletes gigas TaxID=935657 RepID=UPI001C9A9F12|nr:39S ribosomal protein L53, mitochondrial [Colletes gigas]